VHRLARRHRAGTGAPHEVRFGRFGPPLALRKRDGKIFKAPAAGGFVGENPRNGKATGDGVQLYNRRDDFGEKDNGAEKHPDKLRELVAAAEKNEPRDARSPVARQSGGAQDGAQGEVGWALWRGVSGATITTWHG
jgi:hypothetical protein